MFDHEPKFHGHHAVFLNRDVGLFTVQCKPKAKFARYVSI